MFTPLSPEKIATNRNESLNAGQNRSSKKNDDFISLLMLASLSFIGIRFFSTFFPIYFTLSLRFSMKEVSTGKAKSRPCNGRE